MVTSQTIPTQEKIDIVEVAITRVPLGLILRTEAMMEVDTIIQMVVLTPTQIIQELVDIQNTIVLTTHLNFLMEQHYYLNLYMAHQQLL
jgi:hypothetical protein